MSEGKRTQYNEIHRAAGGTMVDFGGWDMPVQYPEGIVAEHLYTRKHCSLFDVSHMGRFLVTGPERLAFLQYVLTSDASALTPGRAQYCILSDENGVAIDDAYLYFWEEDTYLLVVNAANIDKDMAHLQQHIVKFDCAITDISADWASVAVQGPESEKMLSSLNGEGKVEEIKKNDILEVSLEGRTARVARTGYTGEPIGYEVYIRSEDAVWFWNRMVELGAKPAGLGARDTLRLEAAMPLYGHEMGKDASGQDMPIFAVALAKFACSFSPEKGEFIGRAALEAQSDAAARLKEKDYTARDILPKKIYNVALQDRGVIRNGMEVFRDGEQIGWITSGTSVPYYVFEGEGEDAKITDETGKRSIGIAYIASDAVPGDIVEVNVRGRMLKAKVVARHMTAKYLPYVQPLLG